MNEHDRANLIFLMHSTREQLDSWFGTIIDQGRYDDIYYAMELLDEYNHQLKSEEQFDTAHQSDITDVSDAAAYLQRFRVSNK